MNFFWILREKLHIGTTYLKTFRHFYYFWYPFLGNSIKTLKIMLTIRQIGKIWNLVTIRNSRFILWEKGFFRQLKDFSPILGPKTCFLAWFWPILASDLLTTKYNPRPQNSACLAIATALQVDLSESQIGRDGKNPDNLQKVQSRWINPD